MARADELVSSHTDWNALCTKAAEHGIARALIGCSRSQVGRRYLVADEFPAGVPLSDVRARCHAERMGMLEVRPHCTSEQATARLSEIAPHLLGVALVLATAETPPGAWRWNDHQRRGDGLLGLRLVGGTCRADQRILERLWFDDPRSARPRSTPRFERQIGALGEAGQERLRSLTVAVVGCGGTGSQLAQLLALAGVGQLLLIDDDRIEQSNRNRLVAAADADVQRGTHKVVALRRHLRQLAPDVTVVAIPQTLYTLGRAIPSADIVVGCTDNEGSRLHLNALAVQHLLPYVDCGAGIERRAGRLIAGGQVRVVLPGGPCLECYGGIDRWRAARDLETPRERALRHAHGYGLGDERPALSLAFLNASIAAEAAATVAALAAGFRPVVPFLAYDLVGARLAPRDDMRRSPACPTCAAGRRYGRGDSLPLPSPASDIELPVSKIRANECV